MMPLYYAEGGYVWRRSARRKHPDGTPYLTSSFRICQVTDDAGPDAAQAIADMMNFAIASVKLRSDAARTTPDHGSNQ